MAAAAPAAPLLAFGPPGWVAYAVVVVGSAIVTGVVINEMTKDDARTTSTTTTTTTTTTDTARRTYNIPYTVRVHAQGSDIKTGSNAGTSAATIGGVPAIHPTVPITVAEALVISNAIWLMLGRNQAKARVKEKVRLEKWVSNRPPYGYLGEKSFKVHPPKRNAVGARYDIDSLGCTPNMIR